MAVFGAPVAHEDDAARAVRAALAIRDAIAGVKVAVNTGEAVVQLDARSGAEEGIATGDVVATTFRIEEAADVSRNAGGNRVRRSQGAPGEGKGASRRGVRGASRDDGGPACVR